MIGSITGINNPRQETRDSDHHGRPDDKRYVDNGRDRGRYEPERVWVPNYEYRMRYVPRHTEYRPGQGKVVIEGHYERYQVEAGGHWEIRIDNGPVRRYSMR